MRSYQIEAEVLRKEEITSNIFRLTLKTPEITQEALPGQFVMVKATDNITPLLRRPFSIHQAISNNQIQILFKVLGEGTRYLSSLEEGARVDLLGPLGNGFDIGNIEDQNICLVGGGMGIAPLFFLAKDLCRTRPESSSQIKVLLGAATAAELLVIKNDFETLGVATYTATDDGTEGHHGLVTDILSNNLASTKQATVYSCGPKSMLKKVAEICKNNGWSCQVSLETMMACGISACLGCTIESSGMKNSSKYLHVCKDGPVFQAGDVLWG